MGRRGIKAVCLQDGSLTNDHPMLLREGLRSFCDQHNSSVEELSDYTKELISYLSQLFNGCQQRDIHNPLFTLQELDGALNRCQLGETPSGQGTSRGVPQTPPPSQASSGSLWDIAIGRTLN